MVIIQLKVSAAKRKELSQAVTSLLGAIRSEMGCRRCDFFHHMEDENIFCLLEEWDSQKHLEAHHKSESFKVLRGAMNLLEYPCKITSYSIFHPEENEQDRG